MLWIFRKVMDICKFLMRIEIFLVLFGVCLKLKILNIGLKFVEWLKLGFLWW